MKINTSLPTVASGKYSLKSISEAAHIAESRGYDVCSSNEIGHNPYLPLVIAAEHTEKIELQTAIALSFSRSPMDTAYLAWDLQNLSNGRFILGLGSQVRGHIVRRFSMPWGAPAPRTREYINSLKHIWDCWQNGTTLNFAGDHYSFNLMPPFFNPGSIQYPDIKISMAAVNPFMLNVAGELCDGVILHSFNSLKYTNDVIIPNIKKGVTKAGRSMDDIAIAAGGMIIVAKDENDLIIKKEQTKKRIAFYASTKSYSDIMAVHGWQDTHEKLYRMSIDGDWDNMSSHITDEMLDTFAVTGIYEDISCKIKDAYASYASQISFDMEVTTPSEEEILIHIINQLKS